MKVDIKIKKYTVEILSLVLMIMCACIFHCIGFFPSNINGFLTVILQVLATVIGLYFTAFTIFIGLGLSPSKLNLSNIRTKLLGDGNDEKDVEDFINERIVKPYETHLEQATINFKETIAVLIILFSIDFLLYIYFYVSNEKAMFLCSLNCNSHIIALSFSCSIISLLLSLYLVFDSAKLLAKVRKLI